jgi:hypothetical protein
LTNIFNQLSKNGSIYSLKQITCLLHLTLLIIYIAGDIQIMGIAHLFRCYNARSHRCISIQTVYEIVNRYDSIRIIHISLLSSRKPRNTSIDSALIICIFFPIQIEQPLFFCILQSYRHYQPIYRYKYQQPYIVPH